MRKMIAKEEKKIIKELGLRGGLTTILWDSKYLMFKFLTKQFLYGRLYLWLKERIGGILLLAISIFLIFYFHNEYLKRRIQN